MKIANSGPVSTSTVRRKNTSRSAGTGEFAAKLAGEAPAQPVAGSGPVEALNGLLSVQEIGDEPDNRRRAQARGQLLLDRLDELRLGLLGGEFSRHQLNQLLAAVRDRREQINDPRLREVLDEIELRAAVEVAKLGQAA